jgi:predicted dinucleotide-binding enzyme
MQVGILGTGDVARALGTGFAGAGHTVKFGTREPGSEKAKALGASRWRALSSRSR